MPNSFSAICIFSSAPVRSEPSHTSEMSSQMLFGETCEVFEEKGVFGRVRLDFDAYEGWVDLRLLEPHHRDALLGISFTDALVGTLIRQQAGVQSSLLVPLGSSLPNFETPHFQINDGTYAFEGTTRPPGTPGGIDELLSYALRFTNTPYVWGGRTPWGIDCSGLVQQVYRAFGKSLHRDTGQQITQGTRIASLADAKPGDAAFFGEPTNHVGIIFPNRQILHASGFVRMDHLNETGIVHTKTGKLTHPLTAIRRLAFD